jgi:hypothetical protein
MSIQGLSLECSNQSLREGHQGPTRARDPASRGAYSLPGLKYDPKHGAPSGCHFRQLRTPSLHHPEHADTSFAPQGQRASGPADVAPARSWRPRRAVSARASASRVVPHYTRIAWAPQDAGRVATLACPCPSLRLPRVLKGRGRRGRRAPGPAGTPPGAVRLRLPLS